jgi:hypothetical protein
MQQFNATIKAANGIYYIDQQTHRDGDVLYAVMHNSDVNLFSTIAECLEWVSEHSAHVLSTAVSEDDDGISDAEYFSKYNYECNPD